MPVLKVITVWQPWASLIMAGVKPYEFRGWELPVALRNKRHGVHAGARKVKVDEINELIRRLEGPEPWTVSLFKSAVPLLRSWRDDPEKLPRSCVLGTAFFGSPVLGSVIARDFGAPVNDSDRTAHSTWGWPVSAIEHFEPPVPARGAQGWWEWQAPA